MKKIFFLALIICSSRLVSAQEKQDTVPSSKQDTIPLSKKDTTNTVTKMKGAYITVQAGQVLMVKDGKPAKLEKDKALKDGTVVTVDGKIKKTDGNIVQMKEGDKLYVDDSMLVTNNDPIR
jgi:hypothetical protein